MALFRSRRANLEQALTEDMRLLLPADPGLDQLLEAVRLFNPAAKQISGNRIAADGDEQHIILGPAFDVDPDVGRATQLPPDITVAYFVNIVRPAPLPARPGEALTDRYQAMKRDAVATTRAEAKCLINGLASRFGGTAFPAVDEETQPLHADVYLARQLDEAEVETLAARHVRGLSPTATQWSGEGVITLAGSGSPMSVEYWPPRVALALAGGSARGADPVSVAAPLLGSTSVSVLVVRANQPTRGADPGLAQAVGEAALGLASDTGGVCMDLFGFRVLRPDDLVVR
jgi:hypothetical protein